MQKPDNADFSTFSMDELMALHGPAIPNHGRIVRGVVVALDAKIGAWVDFGGKSDGLVPRNAAELNDLKVGQEANFIVANISDDDDTTVELHGPNVADAWTDLQTQARTGASVEVKLGRAVRRGQNCSGVKAYSGALSGFIPYSRLGLKNSELDRLTGTTVKVLVVEASPEHEGKLIFDHKTLARAQQEQDREKLFQSLKVGDSVTGHVAQFADYGVFVDIGSGLQGLLHRSEITNSNARLETLLHKGQSLTVQVIRHTTNKDGKRQLGFSLKRARQAQFLSELKLGDVVTAVVGQVVEYGVFAELSAECRVDGLIHRSEYSNAMRNGRKMLQRGESVRVKVIEIDNERGRVRLSMRDVPQRLESEMLAVTSAPAPTSV